APSHTPCPMAPQSSERRGCCVAPAEQQHAHDADVLGAETKDNPCAEEVRYDAIPAVDFGFTHQGAETADVEAVDGGVAVADHIGSGDGDEEGQENGVYLV